MHKRYVSMLLVLFICAVVTPFGAYGYLSSSAGKDPYISDLLLHEIVNRIGKDFADVADSYIEPMPQMKEMPSRLALMARATKDLEAEQLDYDSLLNGRAGGDGDDGDDGGDDGDDGVDLNSHPSIRDQEYMQHSSLWGHQYVTGGTGEIGPHHFKLQAKTDATLPAYCNPPNPCPVGYTEEQGCQMDFENTAAFSRDYQAAQECMCDGEHMFDCPGPKDGNGAGRQINSDLESFLARQFHTATGAGGEHKNFVAKKFQPYRNVNPYLGGEKLPIAAKKGNHAY